MLFFNSDAIRESGQKVPIYIRIPLGLFVFGSIIYFIITETGPYAWSTDLQIRLLDGDYYPMVSFAFCIISILTPTLLAIWILSKLFSKKQAKK